MKPKWVMVERGRRWCYTLGEKTLGLVVWYFSGRDAYLLFNKKWPKDKKSISYYTESWSSTCWEARRAVEDELADIAAEKVLASRPKVG